MTYYKWLSFPLAIHDPRPPAIPAPELEPLYTIEKDDANVQILRVASHTGTHVDSPLHVVAGGLSLADFGPEEFIFIKPLIVNLQLGDVELVMPPHLEQHAVELAKADLALFRFGYGPIRRSDPQRFSLRSPGFGVEAARWLRENFPGLHAIGMDVPSLACIACLEQTMITHNILLEGKGRRFLVIEDMDLEDDLQGLREVRLCPWLVTEMDSGPCSVVGMFDRLSAYGGMGEIHV